MKKKAKALKTKHCLYIEVDKGKDYLACGLSSEICKKQNAWIFRNEQLTRGDRRAIYSSLVLNGAFTSKEHEETRERIRQEVENKKTATRGRLKGEFIPLGMGAGVSDLECFNYDQVKIGSFLLSLPDSRIELIYD